MSEAEGVLQEGVANRSGAQARRVLFISYDFPPSTAPGAFSCAEITSYLPSYGWEPIVLTVKEGYYAAVDRRRVPPVPVIRTRVLPHPLKILVRVRAWLAGRGGTPRPAEAAVALYPNGATARPLTRRLRDLVLATLGTPDVQTGWIPLAVVSGLRACRQRRISHLVSSGPCWTNHLVGLLLARLTRLPWVAHFRDPWANNPGGRVDSALVRRCQAGLERIVVTRADRVVCVTERHTDLLRRLYPGLRAGKFVTIPNGYDGAPWDDVSRGGLSPPEVSRQKFVITYAGSIDDERTPEPLFEATRRLVDAGQLDIERLRFDFIGWCETIKGRRLEDVAAEHGLNGCVHVESALSKIELFGRLAQSALLLLLAEGLTMQIPSKAYEYLRAGRPVLALTPQEGAVADLFASTGGAWVVEPTDARGIDAALREAYLGWIKGQDARLPDPGAVSGFDRARLAGLLAEVLDIAAAGGRSA